MNISQWNERYRSGQRAAEDWSSEPTPLVVRYAAELPPGRALDLACGTGRNALYLADRGWRVTAVDGAWAALEILRKRGIQKSLGIDTVNTDLENTGFLIKQNTWDLVLNCYYLQRNLIPTIQNALRPGGLAIMIVHIAESSEQANSRRAAAGELRKFFHGWQILHYYEGTPEDRLHKRAVAEIVARRV
jgi:SAM-dependent methyltransferase